MMFMSGMSKNLCMKFMYEKERTYNIGMSFLFHIFILYFPYFQNLAQNFAISAFCIGPCLLQQKISPLYLIFS